MKTFKLHLILMLVLSVCIVYSCDSISDSTPQQSEIQSQELLQSSEAKDKVPVCHVDGQGNYSLISVAKPALKGHEKHGDLQPGDAVPDMEGYVFDDTCAPELSDGVVEITACFAAALKKAKDDYGVDLNPFEDYIWEIEDYSINSEDELTFLSISTQNLELEVYTTRCGIYIPGNTINVWLTDVDDTYQANLDYLEYLLPNSLDYYF